jgi:hypothetical protein
VREILGRDGCEVVAEAGSDGVAVVMLTDSERAEQPVADT